MLFQLNINVSGFKSQALKKKPSTGGVEGYRLFIGSFGLLTTFCFRIYPL